MSASAGRPARTRGGRAGRAAAAALVTAVGVTGLAACGDDPVGPVTGPSSTDMQVLEDRISALEDRVSDLEDAPPPAEPTAQPEPGEDEEPGVLGNGEALVGQAVTVGGEVTELLTVADVGASFRVVGESGDPILVVLATPPADLEIGDLVEVSGRVVRVAEESFELDFGIAADQLFEDAGAFFEEFGGQIAISADRLEPVEDPAG
ncbi:hypothetical protein [Blastococcus xanthinilyticus]|uniref:Uncharacterized protein n=1 Tax=Blastococcus xanthinilyticus TaxID=1564164 RepID=A0A5S5CXT3_9ACTN|nr:hypothetical protein [Blastococcus xanthinilyticus]TYP88587.1 hypothetical protein BD833_104295 [Blastococcus xanthinilyticus]